jgi:hypothetical protein
VEEPGERDVSTWQLTRIAMVFVGFAIVVVLWGYVETGRVIHARSVSYAERVR